MSKAAVVNKYAKSSGISKSTLGKVYQRGLGAYYSSGSRPGVTAHQWAAGRVRSYATGKGGARNQMVLNHPMTKEECEVIKHNWTKHEINEFYRFSIECIKK